MPYYRLDTKIRFYLAESGSGFFFLSGSVRIFSSTAAKSRLNVQPGSAAASVKKIDVKVPLL